MTIETAPSPVTALSILQTDGTEIEGLLRRADPLGPQRAANTAVTPGLWAGTQTDLVREAAGFLDFDLGRVMVVGWGKYRGLRDAGRRTRGTTTTVRVDLAGRDLTLRQHSHVEVRWHGDTLTSIPFVVAVDVRVHAVEAHVRDGRLVELSSGRCVVGVSLEAYGVTLRPKEDAELDPHLVVDLGDGYPLVD